MGEDPSGLAYGGDDFRAYMQEMLDGVMEEKHRESYSGVAGKVSEKSVSPIITSFWLAV